jgi:hypothetical protein
MKNTAFVLTITLVSGLGYTQKINKSSTLKIDESSTKQALLADKSPMAIDSGVSQSSEPSDTCDGIKNDTGTTSFEALYDAIDPISKAEEFYLVTQQQAKGLITKTGKILLKPIYLSIKVVSEKDSLLLITPSKKQMQFANFKGEILTVPYEEVIPYSAGFLIKKDGKWGTLDNQLMVAIKPIHKAIYTKSKDHLIIKDQYNQFGFYDGRGKLKTATKYDNIRALVFQDSILGYIVERFEQYGLVDGQLNTLLPLQKEILNYIETGHGILLTKKDPSNQELTLYSLNGKRVTHNTFSRIKRSSFNKDVFIVSTFKTLRVKENPHAKSVSKRVELYGIMNSNGDFILKPVYEKLLETHNKHIVFAKRKNQWISFDVNTHQIAQTPYTHIKATSHHQYIVQRGGFQANGFKVNGVFGLLDSNFTEIIPPVYEAIEEMVEVDSVYRVKKNGDYGFMTAQGEEIVPVQYNRLLLNSNGTIIGSKTNRKTMITSNTLFSLAKPDNARNETFRYLDFCTPDSLIRFSKNGTSFGIMTDKGRELIAPNFTFINPRTMADSLYYETVKGGSLTQFEDYAEYFGGAIGLINARGTLLLPSEFAEISSIEKQWVLASTYDDEKILINLTDVQHTDGNRFKYLEPLFKDSSVLFIAATELEKLNHHILLDGKFGLMNIDGKFIIPPVFTTLTKNGDFLIGYTLATKAYSLFDLSGNKILDTLESILPLCDSLYLYRTNDMVKAYNAKSKSFIYEDNFIDFLYPEAYFRSSHSSLHPTHTSPLDAQDDFVLPDETAYEFFGIKNKRNKWGIINAQGEIVMKPKYDDLKMGEYDLVIAGKIDEETNEIRYGVVQLNHEIIIPFEYSNIDFDPYDRLVFHCFQDLKYTKKNLSTQRIR